MGDKQGELVERIKKNMCDNSGKILGEIGGPASLYALQGSLQNSKEAVLVSSVHSIGSKLQLALDLGFYHTVGQDCVAMCVNDVLCSGAEPLFFLDHLGCEQLDVDIASALVAGISEACASINIPLLGGNTAEFASLYREGRYNLAGFCTGLVEQENICGPAKSAEGDVLIGLSSNGLHSNGFSLVRKILSECKGALDYNKPLLRTANGKKSLKEVLLNPTTIYAPLVKNLLHSDFSSSIHAMVHIAEGGICKSLPRALQADQVAKIDCKRIPTPEIFHFLKQPQKYLGGQSSSISDKEMWANFNMGLGFVLVVAEEAAEQILKLCDQHSGFGQELMVEDTISANIIGKVSKGSSKTQVLLS